MSKTLDHHVVARAREIISDEQHWTQFDYAQLDTSDEADPADHRAVRFCARSVRCGARLLSCRATASRSPS
jgi:hypothetical protein